MIEEGDRISARFTCNGTFSKAFTGYQPNRTAVQMRSIDISRVKDGKQIEHWDEFNLLEWKYSSKSARRPLERRKDNEPLDLVVISSWDSSTAIVCGTDMFFLTIGRPALRGCRRSAF